MGRRRQSWYTNYYPPSKPIPTTNGIKAKTRTGNFGKTWWGKRFTQTLESFGWTNRLSRGRAYARRGQVLMLNIAEGEITAEVQGSRARPYAVVISMTTFTDSSWKCIIEGFANQALYSAELLAGEMPRDILEKLESISYHLLPTTRGDLKTYCSCPDSANPCKHIAAVYYLVGEQLDEDPFLLFKLRGMPKEKLLDALQKQRALSDETTQKTGGKKKQLNEKKGWKLTSQEIRDYWVVNKKDDVKIPINDEQIVSYNLLNHIVLCNAEYDDPDGISEIVDIIRRQLKPLYEEIGKEIEKDN